MLRPDPVCQVVLWRGIAERGMFAPAVVEQLDVIEGVSNSFLSGFVAGAMHPLILVAVEEAFRRRIVPAVALAAHRTDHAIFLQPAPERRGWHIGFPGRNDGVRPGAGFLRNHAMVKASITMSAVILGFSDQPTTSRLNRSSTTAR